MNILYLHIWLIDGDFLAWVVNLAKNRSWLTEHPCSFFLLALFCSASLLKARRPPVVQAGWLLDFYGTPLICYGKTDKIKYIFKKRELLFIVLKSGMSKMKVLLELVSDFHVLIAILWHLVRVKAASLILVSNSIQANPFIVIYLSP